MAFFDSLLKGKKQTKSSKRKDEEKITFETLMRLFPIRNLSEEKLTTFAIKNKSEVLPANSTLFNINETTDSAIYLLRGTVTLADANGNSYEVESTEAKAKFPLSSGSVNTTTAVAKSEVSILSVSQKIMSITSEIKESSGFDIPEELSSSRLLQNFAHHFFGGEIEVPSLPIVAIKLRKAMRQEIGIDEAVKIIQLDPVISAKLIEVANCPLYVSAVPAKSCFDAIKRIGLNATRSLVITLSMKNVFKCRSKQIKKQMDQLWKNSLHLSSLSYVLASVSKQSNPEEALLAGLVCDIGAVPFLNFVANLPSEEIDEEEVSKALPVIKKLVGAHMLRKWGFAEDFIQVPLQSGSWYQYTEGPVSYTDIVVLSRLHSYVGKKETTDLPMITSIPAASKLKNLTLSPENSLSILHDAKDKINDALKYFSS